MKVIDLLNKIANGEEVPKKIRFNNIEYTLDQNIDSYWNGEKKQWFESRIYGHCLNDEVEIIEEDKKIKKLKPEIIMERDYYDSNNAIDYLRMDLKDITNKINEIIDILNKGE